MSAEYQGQDPIALAKKAEADLNTLSAKGNTTAQTAGVSDSTRESGIDTSATSKFPGATASLKTRDEIPPEEGGGILPSGKPTQASDFEGVGGPEDKARIAREERGGDDDVRGNVRQGGETVRPPNAVSNESRGGEGHRAV
ncbi:hypothetical protein M409DRAFT_19846 [Zasmidium cellare ATCC 36951]|uniref:Uncharacterized protein n=1 Tax=Zasmidium cellare ATCC 36951 TaxID=1080233 RepID=A0A6A6CSW5_ZASCE|nr:uncharacterized protein M409DRAFT_19846 [Zasmidium cellare ATCC 36951]KAF2170244.1 hypothetical protein M409DRAFT_19846 [Zasmidium cellare ATCC 36951]